MSLITIFILLQISLLFIMTFHDWIHIPPFTDIRALEKHSRGLFDRSTSYTPFYGHQEEYGEMGMPERCMMCIMTSIIRLNQCKRTCCIKCLQ